MTPEQTERLFSTLGRIEQKIDSHLTDDDAVHARQDRELSELETRVVGTERAITRAKGWGAGVGTVMMGLLALLGLDTWK